MNERKNHRSHANNAQLNTTRGMLNNTDAQLNTSGGQPILRTINLDKRFGPTHANRQICFSLMAGEVRGLAGENGSGKSTLLLQIAGIQRSDGGTIEIDGQSYRPKSPLDANAAGISIVVQELGLVGELPAGINVFLGKTGRFAKWGIVNLNRIYEAANRVLEAWDLPQIGFHEDPDQMSVENRKMVELARALAVDPRILILDEVTQALSHDNRKRLYGLIRRFKEMGRSVVMISHDLEELVAETDSISILRDGELVATEPSEALTVDALKAKMVGRELQSRLYRSEDTGSHGEEIVLSFRDVSTEDGITDVSFDLHRGEILCFCGLSDSGIHEVGRAAYGLSRVSKGEVVMSDGRIEAGPAAVSTVAAADGSAVATRENAVGGTSAATRKNVVGGMSAATRKNAVGGTYTATRQAVFSRISTPSQAARLGMGYVPKDRDAEALMMDASILDNFTLPSLRELRGVLDFLAPRRLRKMAEDARAAFNVKCVGVDQPMSGLSGGNKQKVNLGRWLVRDLRVLVVSCPTRGVDVGVKAYLYECLKQAKERGIGMILITDELTEAIGMCDSILVMRNGRLSGRIERGPSLREEDIIEVMV